MRHLKVPTSGDSWDYLGITEAHHLILHNLCWVMHRFSAANTLYRLISPNTIIMIILILQANLAFCLGHITSIWKRWVNTPEQCCIFKSHMLWEGSLYFTFCYFQRAQATPFPRTIPASPSETKETLFEESFKTNESYTLTLSCASPPITEK